MAVRMTRAEAENHIRLINRRCRGPHTPKGGKASLRRLLNGARAPAKRFALDPDSEGYVKGLEAVALAQPGHGGFAAKDIEIAREGLALIARAGQVRELLEAEGKEPGSFARLVRARCSELIEKEQDREASALDDCCREGCGHDLNEVILSKPLDGLARTVKCPKCGQDISYTPAEIEIVPDTPG